MITAKLSNILDYSAKESMDFASHYNQPFDQYFVSSGESHRFLHSFPNSPVFCYLLYFQNFDTTDSFPKKILNVFRIKKGKVDL